MTESESLNGIEPDSAMHMLILSGAKVGEIHTKESFIEKWRDTPEWNYVKTVSWPYLVPGITNFASEGRTTYCYAYYLDGHDELNPDAMVAFALSKGYYCRHSGHQGDIILKWDMKQYPWNY